MAILSYAGKIRPNNQGETYLITNKHSLFSEIRAVKKAGLLCRRNEPADRLPAQIHCLPVAIATSIGCGMNVYLIDDFLRMRRTGWLVAAKHCRLRMFRLYAWARWGAFMNVTMKVRVRATHNRDSQGHPRDYASAPNSLSFAGSS